MAEQIPLGETTAGKGATGPGGRTVSLPLSELTSTCGLVAGAGGAETASVLVDALADHGVDVFVFLFDCDGTVLELSTAADVRRCRAADDADVPLEAENAEVVVDLASRKDGPVVVDGRRTDDAALAALARSLLRRSAGRESPGLAVVSGLPEVLPDDGSLDEVGRAFRRLVTRGPDRGLGVCVLAGRPAAVDEAVRDATDWSLWHRLTRTADTSVVRRELDGEHARAVRDLADDEAFLSTEWTVAIERLSVDRPADRFEAPPTCAANDVGTHQDDTRETELSALVDDLAVVTDRLADVAADLDGHVDPDRLAADIADALEPRIRAARNAGDDPGTTGSPTDGARASNGQSADDSFEGFDWFEESETANGDSGADDGSAATDGLAALAGNGDGDDTSTAPSARADGSPDRDVGTGDDTPAASSARNDSSHDHPARDGGLDVEALSTELAAFEDGVASVPTAAESSGGNPAVVVDLESTLANLDDAARGMLDYYRTEGPARPETAHSAATGRASRVPAYTLNRGLRRAGLVQHVGRGRYEYSLRERIAAGLSPDRDEEMAAVYARGLEQEYLD